MAKVVLKGITKVFDHGVVALEEFDLEVEDGQFVTILGPSGSGKSTALRIVAGLERHDKGDVSIDDTKVNDMPPQDREIAFVFQSYALYPHMSVYENIAVGLRLRGMARDAIEQRVREVSNLLEIDHLLDRRPKTLSGGQKQRVALSRAIARRPRVFLLDEPLSNLDAVLRERMRVELKTLFNRLNATVIYVTHDQGEAMSLSDRIAVIDNGRIRQFGCPEELYEKPADLFVASFIGSPRINTFQVTIEGREFVFGPETWPIPERYLDMVRDKQEAILAVRPEDISIDKREKDTSLLVKPIMSERLGNMVVLSLEWHGKVLRVPSTKEEIEDMADEFWIELDRDKLLLFDPLTGKVLNN